MKVAVGLPQLGDDFGAVLRAAKDAEDAGAWGVWVFDNLAGVARPGDPVLDGWTLLGPLARETSRVRLVMLVSRAGLRHPALVARMSAVVQSASSGRFVLGLGIGDAPARREHARFGIPTPPRRDRIAALRETVARVRGDDMPVRPVVEPPPVWIGGLRDDLVDAAAETADAWHGWDVDAAGFADRAARARATGERAARAGGFNRRIECWWGGMFDPQAADDVQTLGADGVTWMIASRRDAERRPQLLRLVRERA